MNENIVLTRQHYLIVIAPSIRGSVTVRMTFDVTPVLLANHRHFLMTGNDGQRYVVAFHNRIDDDEKNGKMLRYLRDTNPLTKNLNLKFQGELSYE